MIVISTVSSLVHALGGRARAAQAAGVIPTAVSNWAARGVVPPEHYLALSDAIAAAYGPRVAIARSLFGRSPRGERRDAEKPRPR